MKKINISQIDTAFVNGSYPIEFLFFYKNKIKTNSISKALKRLSTSFWPLFGKYSDGYIQASPYSEGRFFQEIVQNSDFDPAAEELKLWKKYNQVNANKMDGLFYLSILQFKNGTVLIPKINHLVGDGYSYFYFLSVLAAITGSSLLKGFGIFITVKPQIKRTILKDFSFTKTNIEQPIRHHNFTINIEKVLKSYVKEEIKVIKLKHEATVSTNDILSALVFKKIFEQQKDYPGDRFSLSIPIDVRRQVKKLGPKFFGNGLMFHHFGLSTTELDATDSRQLAVQIRNSMPEVNTQNYLEYLSKLESEIEKQPLHTFKPYNPDKGCLVTNLSKMPVQNLNFGTGNPDFIFTLTIGRNSVAILTDKDNFLLRMVH